MFLLHHPIWVEEGYMERKRTFQRACERKTIRNKQKKVQRKNNNKNNQHKQTNKQTKTKQKRLDVITFQIVLDYVFGEINLYNVV